MTTYYRAFISGEGEGKIVRDPSLGSGPRVDFVNHFYCTRFARAFVTVFAKREIKTRPAIVRERHRRVPLVLFFFSFASRSSPTSVFIFPRPLLLRPTPSDNLSRSGFFGLSLPRPWPFWHAPCQQFRSANTRIAPRTYTCMYITLAETIKTLNKRSPLATMAFSVSPLRLSDYTYIMCTIETYNIHLYTCVYIITMASRYSGSRRSLLRVVFRTQSLLCTCVLDGATGYIRIVRVHRPPP